MILAMILGMILGYTYRQKNFQFKVAFAYGRRGLALHGTFVFCPWREPVRVLEAARPGAAGLPRRRNPSVPVQNKQCYEAFSSLEFKHRRRLWHACFSWIPTPSYLLLSPR